MNKKHLIKVIEAIEAVIKLDDIFVRLTGTDLGVGECAAVYGLWDVIEENAKKEYLSINDINGDGVERLCCVLKNANLTACEKYDILIGD